MPAFRAFQDRGAGFTLLLVGAPALTLIVGADVDRISDPHRVDLCSPPLLAIITWI